MARRLGVLFTLTVIFFAGCCSSGNVQTGLSGDSKCDGSCAPLIERLRAERLPALQSAVAWQNEYGPGLKLTTAHYEIFTTISEPLMLRRIPGFVESAYRAYNMQIPRPLETRQKFTIYLFADRRQWEAFTQSFAGEHAPVFRKIKTGAYYLQGACVVYDIGPSRTLAALGHEGWHQFNSRYFSCRLPSWLDEGIAMLFETCRYEAGIYHFDPADNAHRLDSLKQTLSENQLIPLHELISISPGEVLASNQDETVMAFYSQSYALVRFLLEAGRTRSGYDSVLRHKGYADSYHRLLWDGLRGNWPLDRTSKTIAADRNTPRTVEWNRLVGRQLFTYYISPDFEQVEKQYVSFCRSIVSDIRAQPSSD